MGQRGNFIMGCSILHGAMSFRLCVLACVLVGPIGPLVSEISVHITPPELIGVGGVLEDLISQQEINALISEPLGRFETQVEDQLEGTLGKGALYQGLSDAVLLPLLSFARPGWESSRGSLALGIGAGVQSDTFDYGTLVKRFHTLRPEDDYRFGATLQPLNLSVSWTLSPGVFSWSVGAFASWATLSYTPVSLTTGALGASTHWGYHLPDAVWGPFSWEGATLSVGAGWATNRYASEVEVPLPEQRVTLDLTYLSDAGTVAINGTPRVAISLNNSGLFLPVQVSSEVSVARTFRLGGALGLVFAYASSSLDLKARSVFTIVTVPVANQQPVYERFFGDTAQIEVEGTEGGSVGPWVQPFATVTPTWSLGAFRFGLPLTYRWEGGLAGALVWGLSL